MQRVSLLVKDYVLHGMCYSEEEGVYSFEFADLANSDEYFAFRISKSGMLFINAEGEIGEVEIIAPCRVNQRSDTQPESIEGKRRRIMCETDHSASGWIEKNARGLEFWLRGDFKYDERVYGGAIDFYLSHGKMAGFQIKYESRKDHKIL